MNIETLEMMLKEKRDYHRLLFEHRRTEVDYLMKRLNVADEILDLERKIASEQGVTHAVPWDGVGDVWYGLAEAITVGDSLKCSVIFGTKSRKVAAILFDLIAAFKLEHIGDEVVEAHPLQGRGFAACQPLIVKKSSWMEILRSIDSTHPHHIGKGWEKSQHYMLGFKDCIIEIIAQKAGLLGIYDTLDEATKVSLSVVSQGL